MSEESKHTPGPWQAVRSMPAEGADCWWICAGGGNREKELAVVYAGVPTHIGNARLIAAAPDLLEALHELVAEIADTEGATGVSRYTCDRARAALSRVHAEAEEEQEA